MDTTTNQPTTLDPSQEPQQSLIDDIECKTILEPGHDLIEGKVCVLIEPDNGDPNYYVSVEDGDFVSLALPDDFRVIDDASYDLIMKQIGKSEAAIVALTNDADVVWARTIIANSEAMKKRAQNKVNWILYQYVEQLRDFASGQLKDKSGRTYYRVSGAVELRKVPESVQVLDEAEAVKWAEKKAKEAVKVEKKLLISKVSSELKASIKAVLTAKKHKKSDAGILSAFFFKPESESYKVKTGVTPPKSA